MPVCCVAPLEMNEGNSLGQGYNRPTGCSAERPHTGLFYIFIYLLESSELVVFLRGRVSGRGNGSSHHGMSRSQVAIGRTASNMEGSSEYIE